MITKEMLLKRIENCEKRIEEIKQDGKYTMLGGSLTTEGYAKVKYWKGQKRAYETLLEDVEQEEK